MGRKTDTTEVLIAGLGKGGAELIAVLKALPAVKVTGSLEIRNDAPGVEAAKEAGIPVYKSPDDAPEGLRPQIILNVTGDENFAVKLKERFPDSEVISGEASKLIFELVSVYRKYYEIYEGLYRASISLLSKEKQHEVLTTILNEALSALSAPAGSIALYEPSTRQFYLAASTGMSKRLLSMPRWKARKGGLTDTIIKSEEQPIVINDITESSIDVNPLLIEEGVRFVAAARLIAGGNILGILYIDDFKKRELSESERTTLKLFSHLAGLALEKFRLIEQSRELAITDGLTHLYNHRYFYERISSEISRAKRAGRMLSVVIFDVDFFKKYNDANGHLLGDEALKRIATIIRENIRRGDVAARYGGEEFVVLLPEADRDAARKVAERVRKKVEEVCFEGEETLPNRKLTISAGVATYPEDAEEKDELIKAADDALYTAKQKGRNLVVCSGDPDQD